MFSTVTHLLSRGPVDQEEPAEAPAGLEVDFEAGERLPDETAPETIAYGHDVVVRYPARRPGWTGWLVRRTWTPAWGYSAQGVEDSLE